MVEKDDVRRAYDDLGASYSAVRPDDGREVQILDEFLSALSTPARLLDAGCGPGTPVLDRLATSGTAVGLDLSREQLRLAATNVPAASLVRGDLSTLPIRNAVFDAITAYHSLIHVPLDEHRSAFEEFARILRPGGRVLLSEGSAEWTGTNPDWLDSGVEMQWGIAGSDATREHLRSAGFAVVDEWTVSEPLDDVVGEWLFLSARLAED